MVTGAAVVGSLIGGRLTSMVDPDALRKVFGWFVLLMSSVILAQELHPAVGIAAAVLTLIAPVAPRCVRPFCALPVAAIEASCRRRVTAACVPQVRYPYG